ncbi:taurine catabolism dioxygenase TauD, TfdA family protein [Aspergillus indologenus CBS 114.80]|uniref:Taurine catabolism dioxygenase TauD, TfdA family protein n=1 Tax=Aspergillus indologenus CBS 114.80 TaxID=1450541 RepID=A0A2V5IZ31_9EURO|nr:taurine catabolism dioxygenase TauD, TfdA family protein [Aspergillus indologenus CBS 114.80]
MTIPPAPKTPSFPKPMRVSGALNEYTYTEVAPALGRDYPDLQLSSILNDDAKIRDLAIVAAERGVIFLHNQDISMDQFKELVHRFGVLTGKPKESRLHKHGFSSTNNKHLGVAEAMDPELYAVSSVNNQSAFDNFLSVAEMKFSSRGWHTDESYEHVPADYSGFKMVKAPKTGGDTVWASSYAIYERLSGPFQKLAESLQATHGEPDITPLKTHKGLDVRTEERGHPENVGDHFSATHPVVQTNPVTGWKSLFGLGWQVSQGGIEGVTEHENQLLQAYFLKLITDNHELHIRHRWQVNDIAIWDNRSVFHNPTYNVSEERLAFRAVSIGGKPYLDPNSKSQSEDLRARSLA